MKKVILLFVAVIGFTVMSNNVLAQSKGTTEKAVVKTEQTVTTPGKFVDKNNNGICDNHEAKVKDGKCTNFVDKDGNGVCDNYTGKGKCSGKGTCCGKHKSNTNCCGKHKGNGKGNCYRHGQNL